MELVIIPGHSDQDTFRKLLRSRILFLFTISFLSLSLQIPFRTALVTYLRVIVRKDKSALTQQEQFISVINTDSFMANSISSYTQIGGIRPKFSVYIFDKNDTSKVFRKFDSIDLCAVFFCKDSAIIRQTMTKKRELKGYYISKVDYWNEIDSKLI